ALFQPFVELATAMNNTVPRPCYELFMLWLGETGLLQPDIHVFCPMKVDKVLPSQTLAHCSYRQTAIIEKSFGNPQISVQNLVLQRDRKTGYSHSFASYSRVHHKRNQIPQRFSGARLTFKQANRLRFLAQQ